MIKYSIIIPSYNCSKWIEKTLTSVFKQKYKGYEVIIVDDMSTDNSVEVIKRLIKGKDNAKLFINKSKRYSGGTRNVGITEASGEYILFIDCDDWLSDDEVLNKIDEAIDNVDVLYLGYKMMLGSEIIEDKVLDVYSKEDAVKLAYPAPWLRVAKRELYFKSLFPEGTMYEDRIQNYYLVLNAKKFSSLGISTHVWNRNNENATTFNPRWAWYRFEFCGELYRLIKENEDNEYVDLFKEELKGYVNSIKEMTDEL